MRNTGQQNIIMHTEFGGGRYGISLKGGISYGRINFIYSRYCMGYISVL